MCLNCCKRVDGFSDVNAADDVDSAESPANLLTSVALVALLSLIFLSLLQGETSHE